MALVTNVTKDVDIPNEKESAVIRKLSHRELRDAQKARRSDGISFMREMGGELLRALRDTDTSTDEAAARIKKLQDAQEADVNNYDRDTLLRYGIVSWTYPVKPLVDVGLNGIDQLDEPTAKFLSEEIFKFSRPESADEAKNVSGASTNS